MSKRKALARKTVLAVGPDVAQSVYNGRHHLGWALLRGMTFHAIRSDRITIGSFDTVLRARNALWCGEEVSNG